MKTRLSLLTGRSKQISILLTIIAILLWSHSILYARFEIGHFGLISGLPITFFVALALLTVASAILWVSKEKHGKLLCLQLLILISALGLIPLMTGGSPPFINHSYRNLGYIDYIVRQNHFDASVSAYFSWPGAFIIAAIIAKVGSINFEPLIEMLPICLLILSLLPLYVFLKNTLGEARSNYCWAGCWLFYLASYGAGNLISAGGIVLFLFLIMLALVTNPSLWRKDSKPLALLFLIAIVFAAMTITHLLTSLAALGIIAALCLARLDKRLALAVGACLIILMAWNLTGAGGFVQKRLPTSEQTTLIGPTLPPGEAPPSSETPPAEEPPPKEEPPRRGMIILDPEVLVEREITGHLSGSESHSDVAKVRILFAGIFVLIGLAGVISALVMRKNLKTTITLLAITIAPLVLVVLSGHYAREILTRLYLFALPGMAYFGAVLLDTKRSAVTTILCLLLIMAIPLHVIASYGNQELDYFSPGQRSGIAFSHNETSQGLVCGAWPMGKVKNIEQMLNNAVNCDFIYNNPDFKLYISEGR